MNIAYGVRGEIVSVARGLNGEQGHAQGPAREILVGIDDTDDLHSPGTGYHARQLGQLISSDMVGQLLDITRHQLLFDSRIPYTSHNSSLCLRLAVEPRDIPRLVASCRAYLLENSARASDAGLCVADWSQVSSIVRAFGARAKQLILTQAEARDIAGRHDILLEGLTGDQGGVIGALAAVGLRKGGADGRIAWRPGIREARGIVSAGDLLARTGTDAVRRIDTGEAVDACDRINIEPWARSVLIGGEAVLLVEKAGDFHDQFDWQLVSKDILKRY